MSFEPVIGLEVHAQLLTNTKIFCACRTAFGAAPNTQVCPVCLGLPGALPVLNRAAVDAAIGAALALGCTIHETSVLARKNYFYPDLPKGYQISQYERPLATGGLLDQVRITRVHIEEDAGKSVHEGFAEAVRKSRVDFNRSGTPLIEIVTEPDLRSAADAARFFSRLRTMLVWLGLNDGNMEEGSLRCDANVSVRRAGDAALGTKAEVKNLNSFKFLQRALEHEIDRQMELLSSGGRIIQETRLWDASAGRTVSMRSKEEAHDYRYFPEPDLLPVTLAPARVEAVRSRLPELPEVRRRRFIAQYALPEYDAFQLTESRAAADFFESTVAAGATPKQASNWIRGEVARLLNETGATISAPPVSSRGLASLIGLVERGTISGSIAKGVLEKMAATGRDAAEIVAADGLAQVDDESEIHALVAKVVTEQTGAVTEYRAGKTAALGFLVGQVMRATGGRANPKRVNQVLKSFLENDERRS